MSLRSSSALRRRLATIVGFGLLLGGPGPIAAADLGAISINSDNSLRFEVFDPTLGGSTVASPSFGRVGDHVFIGPFVTPTESHLGVIAQPTDGGAARWRLIDRTGAVVGELNLGRADDLFVAGGDFNGDGIADPAVVDVRGKTLRWRISPGAFAPTPGTTITRKHGLRTERGRVFYAADGDGRDLLGTVRQPPGQNRKTPRYQLRLLDAVTGDVRTVTVPRSGAITNRPVPVGRPDGTDFVAFVREVTGGTRVTFISSRGQRAGSHTFTGTGTVVVADLDPSAPGEEVALHAGSGLAVYNPTTRSTVSLSAPEAILVDSVNLNGFSNDSSGEPVQCGGVAGRCGCRFLDETDGYKIGFVYKARSETFGGIVAVLPNPCGRSTTGVTVLDLSCREIEPLSDNGYGNADGTGVRHHFKRRDNHTGEYYQREFGSIILRLDGTDACYLIEEPAKARID